MVKSVFVPTAPAPAPASAPIEIAAAPVKVKTETKEEEYAHDDDDDVSNSNSNKEPTIDFSSVFHELQTFQQDHNGSLAIPESHPALARIIDSLSDLSSVGIIGLSRKRWEKQMKALQSYREKYGHVNVPPTNHHPLGNWARIQREQYRLYEEGEPNELTKKRYGKLKAIGFDDQVGVGGGTSRSTTANAKSGSRDHSDKDDNDDAKPSKKSSGKQKRATATTKSDDKTTANITAKQEDGSEQAAAAAAVNGVKNTERVKVELSEELRNDGGKRLKGKCDVCEKSDGFWGHNLQQCQKCGLLVHELCYGLAETGCKDPNFVCHACKAVGASVEVNVPSKLGGCGDKMGKKREMIQQNERPSQCSLCSHDKGIHAMHPLLDTHGTDGRQLVVDHSFRDKDGVARKEKRLAWVHTLCAQVICANPRTASSVYGCDKHGNFYGDGEEEYCDDGREEEFEVDNTSSNNNNNNNKSDETNNANNESANDEQEDGDQGDENCLNDLTSFAIATEEGYAQNIQDHRGLKCYICGKKDKTFMIPLQCIAGDQEEHGRWKNRHKRGTECFMGMHVGCARWGCVESEGSHLEKIGGKLCRQCWFTPGRDDNDDDEGSKDSHGEDKNRTVAHCYCKIHARDLVLNNPKNKGRTTGNTSKSSPVGKAKAKLSRKKPPAKEAPRRKKPGSSAQPSLKKSLNSISKKSGKKNGSRKRKADEEEEDDDAKGAFGVPSKKSKVGFATSLVQYPVRGRSASALVGMSGAYVVPPPPAAPMSNPSALASSNTNKGPVTGILRRTSSTGSFGLPQQGPVPDKPKSGPIPYAPMSGSIKQDTPEQDFGGSKRKAAPEPDLPVSGSVKRIKFED